MTKIEPACFGVCCFRAEKCARYHALEGTHLIPPIGTCNWLGIYALFVPMEQKKPDEKQIN